MVWRLTLEDAVRTNVVDTNVVENDVVRGHYDDIAVVDFNVVKANTIHDLYRAS